LNIIVIIGGLISMETIIKLELPLFKMPNKNTY